MPLVIACADVGSIPNGRFGWAEYHVSANVQWWGTDIHHLRDRLAIHLNAGCSVALGFECPLFIPAGTTAAETTRGRQGEGNRPWSAGAGSGAMATGLSQSLWLLSELRRLAPSAQAFLDWKSFVAATGGLFVWEAFVSGTSKGSSHAHDAELANVAFAASLPDPDACSAVRAPHVLSLAAAVLLHSGWSTDTELLRKSVVVIKATSETASLLENVQRAEYGPSLPLAPRDVPTVQPVHFRVEEGTQYLMQFLDYPNGGTGSAGYVTALRRWPCHRDLPHDVSWCGWDDNREHSLMLQEISVDTEAELVGRSASLGRIRLWKRNTQAGTESNTVRPC